MAGEIEAVEESGEAEVQADVGLGDDNTLSSLFTNAAAGHTPLEDEPEEEPEETPEEETTETPPAPDPRIDEHSSHLRTLEDKITELTTQNNILRYQQQQKPQTEEEDRDQEYTLESFREQAAKDPTTAIFKLFEQSKKNAVGSNQQAIQQAEQRAIQVMERQKAYESDQASTVARYGALMRDNPKFANFAEKVYSQMVNNSPGSIEIKPGFKWGPGLMYAAASIAYAEMHAAGDLPNANPKVTALRPVKKAPQNPLIGKTDADQPKTFASEIPARELSIMRKTAKSMGITLERYIKITEELQKRDPSFGKA